MKKLLKYPIFIFGIVIVILIVWLAIFIEHNDYPLGYLFGFFWLGYFALVYGPLILISLFFVIRKTPYRIRYEVALIAIFTLVMYLVNFKPEPKNYIYLYNQSDPFSKYDQNFILVFGIEGQPEMDDNFYFNNIINIPEDGIYLTSSTFEDGWGGRFGIWQVKGLSEWNDEAATYSRRLYGDPQSCNDKLGIKLDFLAMTVNPSDDFDSEWFDAVSEKLCEKINGE